MSDEDARQAPRPHLSQRLKTARHDRGLSQAQAARELDVARSAYRLWEMDAALPEPRRWQPVATWLGVTVTALLLAEGLISDDEAPAPRDRRSNTDGA
jgi:transcriptional regulator with XRE-family HTH domain